MPLTGEYEPSTSDWVRTQVDTYEATNGREANTMGTSGIPVIIVTSLGASTAKLRKSMGGAPSNPSWYHNLIAEPLVMIQDGPEPHDYVTHIAEGDERAVWWDRAVDVFPTYADYERKTDRVIPVFIARRAD
jgi:hypothetical protein